MRIFVLFILLVPVPSTDPPKMDRLSTCLNTVCSIPPSAIGAANSTNLFAQRYCRRDQKLSRVTRLNFPVKVLICQITRDFLRHLRQYCSWRGHQEQIIRPPKKVQSMRTNFDTPAHVVPPCHRAHSSRCHDSAKDERRKWTPSIPPWVC